MRQVSVPGMDLDSADEATYLSVQNDLNSAQVNFAFGRNSDYITRQGLGAEDFGGDCDFLGGRYGQLWQDIVLASELTGTRTTLSRW